LKNVSLYLGDIRHPMIGLIKNQLLQQKGMKKMDPNKMEKNETSTLRKKLINQTTLILYGFMLLVPIVIWFLFNNAIETSGRANLWTAIFTTLLANGLVGMINTFVLSKEKDKVLDESIERVKAAFLDEQFVTEKIDISLNRGFKYCENKVKTFRVYAVSTTQIFPIIDARKEDVCIENCMVMVRGYGENMSEDEKKSDNEIKFNIQSWEALKPDCINNLTYIRYNNYPLFYYCIFDDRFITLGQYYVNEVGTNIHKIGVFDPFSITNETKVGQQIIRNSIDQFDRYFNSEKKKSINFNEFASRYDTLRCADDNLIRTLIKDCDIKKTNKILDFGCGTGNYIKKFQEEGFNEISGLDTSEKMREITLEKTNAQIYEHIRDINEIFDIILIIDVIHFIKDVYFLAENLYHKCADNGKIIVVTQSHEQIKSRYYKKFFPTAIDKDLERYHDIDTLTQDFQDGGFSLWKNTPYKKDSKRILDSAFLYRVKNKCFSMFELIDENDFNNGVKKFEEALIENNNQIKEKYAGKTILVFSKTRLE
jgi:2-polyprenyl-3-methyl-5-hydroxy-6-metoxy-1,4-benzoquinol methylase